jgi:bifunctional non-homologous end joining protein LigD
MPAPCLARRGIQYVEHTEGDGVEMFKAVCKLGLEGIVSKKLNAPYKSGPSKAWLKIKNPKEPAGTVDGTFLACAQGLRKILKSSG